MNTQGKTGAPSTDTGASIYQEPAVCVCVCVCVCAHVLSHVQLFVTPWTSPPASSLCPGNFPSKKTRVGGLVLFQGIFPAQRSNPHLLHLLHWQVDSLLLCHLGSILLFNRSVASASLLLHELQHTRPPCPSLPPFPKLWDSEILGDLSVWHCSLLGNFLHVKSTLHC